MVRRRRRGRAALSTPGIAATEACHAARGHWHAICMYACIQKASKDYVSPLYQRAGGFTQSIADTLSKLGLGNLRLPKLTF